jgi:hypothetical protein
MRSISPSFTLNLPVFYFFILLLPFCPFDRDMILLLPTSRLRPIAILAAGLQLAPLPMGKLDP